MEHGKATLNKGEDGTVAISLDDDAAGLVAQAAARRGIPEEGMVVLALMNLVAEKGEADFESGRACDLLLDLADEVEKASLPAETVAEAIRYYAQFAVTSEVPSFKKTRGNKTLKAKGTRTARPSRKVGPKAERRRAKA